MSVVQGQDYYWAFTGDGTLDSAWLYLQSSDGSYVNNHWRINSLLFGGWTSIGYVDMGLNASFSLARDEDWLTLSNTITNTGHFRLNLKGVEYIDAPLDKNISLEVVSKDAFTTDGSLISLSMNVGNHTLNYWDAARDSTLFQGSGWDTVNLNDNPDIPGTQYWTLIRRGDGQIDAYSLFSGNRIRLEGGTVTWNNNNNTMNYGEVEKFFMKNARTGGTEEPAPGNVIPTAGLKYLDVNIDLRSYESGVNTYFSDSFNLAYFNYIRYTSDNIWTGEATIYDAVRGRYSAVSDTKVAGATSLAVAGTNRNGTHDLILGEQANYIDGQLRLYAFNVASGSYNTFNDVYLGTAAVDGKSYSSNTATAVDRVAIYGFGGNDILTGGSGNDYIFGGQGYYNQLTGDTGNQITGGAGADFFGVGNTNTSGAVTGSNTWGGYNGGEAELGYAADRITDWHAGTDTLEVLSNGVAVISGLYGVSGMAGNNTLDLRDYSSVVTVNQDGDNARGNDNWDSTQSLQYVYDNQTSRDLQSIKNEGSDISVVNNGLIIARGQGGDDTVYGSAGNDYIYGNEGRNLLNLSEGGNDRAFLDTRSGKQYVSDFNDSGSGSGSDKFYLAKNIVDAFGGNSGRSMAIYDASSSGYNYTHGSGYSQGIDFLYGLTYKSYLSNAYGSQPYTNDQSYSMDLSADVTTYVSGIVSIGIGIGLCFIPFIGPALGAPLIATGTLLTAGKIYSDLGNTSLGSVPHINPVYDLTPGGASFTSNYVYVLNNPERPVTTAATGSSLSSEDNLRFLDFFPQAYKNDGFTAALELNPGYWNTGDTGDGIFGYFVVYSTTETFVYLVTSQDHLIENHEAMKVAELSGFRSASDFVVYDSNYDPYNQRADAAVVLKKPTITQVIENSGPTYTANVPLLAYTQSPYLKVLGSIASIDPGRTATTTVNKVELFDSNSPENGVVGTAFLGAGATSFEISDTRVLGQLIIQTDYSTVTGALNPLSMDNTFEYQDRRVIYYATLYNDVDGDGEMVIETRSNTFSVIDNGPSTATVDGGAGRDTLMLESTSLHLNNASDGQILSIEMISVKPPMGPGLSVTVSGGAVTAVNILDSGAKIADGTYDLTLSDDTTSSESGATGWKVVVSGGKATSIIAGSGGSGYTASTYANADWVPVGVTIDIHAQSEGFTVTGYQGADSIIGAQGHDVINGLNANDTIDGGTGNDTIEGGAGQDNLSGSAGGDTFVVTSVSDFAAGETISGGSNASTVDRLKLSQVSVSGPSTAPVTSPATGTYSSAQLSGSVTGVEVIELAVDAAYSLTLANGIYAGVDADGNGSEDNTLTITPTVNLTHDVTIVGGASTSSYELKVLDNGFLDGNDSITGGAGNDTLEGGIGNDTMSGGAIATYSGSDSIDAGGGNDLIVQTLYQTVNDTIIGGADIDKLTVTQSSALAGLDNRTQVVTVELLSGLGANFSYTISDASAFDADTTGVTIDGDALTSTEALAFSATNLTRSITILGGAGNDTIIDGGGNDSIVTNAGNDSITLSGAGANTVSSGSGTDLIILGAGTDWVDAGNNNDTVVGGANVTVADTLDGGADIDLLTISNDNSTDDLNNVTRFETIRLAAGQSYQYVIGDGSLFDQDTVAVTVDAQALGAGDAINFDASNLDRSITILFGAGDDTIYGGNGTSDSINAGGGDDLIIMSNQLNGTDSIDGSSGFDYLTFSDNGTATSDLDHVTNIEVITLGDSVTSVVTVDALVASGQTLTIDATGLNGTNTLNWNGAGETNGHFSVDGSGNNDTITGGAGNDTFTGGAGVDSLTGGNGDDVFVYNSAVSDQTGAGETIAGGSNTDTIVVAGGSTTVDFSNDSISAIETLEMTVDVYGNADGNDQTVKMTDGQVDALSSINANDGTTSGSSDRIIITDAMTSDMLSNGVVGGGITVVNGTLTVELTEQSGATAQALTLVDGNLTSSSDLLKVDASTLTTNDTLSFAASAETTARVSVTGGVSDDSIVGSNANLTDTLSGGSGNDTIEGKAGVDSLLGNDGDDTFVYDSATTDATGSGETINGGNDTDRILVAGGNTAVNFSNDTIISIETLELAVDLAGTAETNNQQVTLTNNQVDGLSTINANGDTVTVSNTLLSGMLDGTTINGTLTMALTDQSGGTVVAQALTLVDGTLDDGVGDVLTLDGSGLTSDTLNFNGAAEDDSKVSVTGGAGHDTIVGTNSALTDTLDGGSGNDTIQGNAGADSLVGGDGNDTFVYNSASDESDAGEVIDGSSNTDRILVTGSGAAAVDFTNDTITSIETLGMTQDSVGAADGADQTVRMTNAQIDGLSTINSDAGTSSPAVSDTLIVSDAVTSSMLDGTVVSGTLTLQLSDQSGGTVVGQALTLVNTTLGATDLLKVDASALSSDTFSFDASADSDSIVSVTGGAANDTLVGTASSVGDTLLGGLGADSITGGAGHDSVLGGGGADTITMSVAASSIDSIDAGDQTDWLKLDGAAAGTVVVNLDAGAGNDQITDINTVAESVLQTNFENLDASAMTGAGIYATALGTGSHIIGSAQNDTLLGGTDVDTLTGGGGVDYINGGMGVNTIAYTSWSQTTSGSTNYGAMDVIEANALEDQIDLSALSATSTISAVQGTWNGSTFTANSTGDDYVIGWSDAGSNANYVILKDTGASSGLDLTLTSGVLTYAAKPATLSAMAPVVANGAGTALLSSGSTYNAGWMADNYTYTSDYYPSGGGFYEYFIPYRGMQWWFDNQNVDILSVSLESAVLGKTNYAPNGSGGFSLPELTALNFSFSLNGGGTFSTPSTSSWRPEIWRDEFSMFMGFNYDSYLDYGTILAGASAGTQASPGSMGFMLFNDYGSSPTANINKISLVFGDGLLTSSDTEQKIIIQAGVSPNLFYAGWYFGTAGNNTYADASGDSMSVSDMMMGRGGNDSLDGGDLNDTLYGGFGNDAVGSGDDTLIGGAGDDYVWGEDGNDLLLGDGGVDTLLGGAGDDDITGGDGHDSVLGGDGADTITMSIEASSIDTINAGNQTDLLVLTGAAAGTVVLNLNAGAGNDQLSSINSTAENIVQANFENLDASAMTGGGINATAISTGSNIIGSAQADTITGGNGNDTITGGAGGDALTGGSGDDLFVLNAGDVAAGESYDGGGDTDTLQITATTDFTGVSTLDSIEVMTLSQGVTVTFDAAALTGDTIAMSGTNDNLGESVIVNGTSSGETIDLSNITVDINDIAGISVTGLGGDDTITGSNGNDTLVGGAGADVLAGGSGNDTLVINSGDVASGESYDGGNNDDTLSITADMNLSSVTSLTGIETITLANGVDVTFSAAALTGDTLTLNGTGDNAQETVSVTATAGNDTINLSGITVDTNDITGLYIDGAAGNDSISGTNGADTILGGDGDDSIAGGSGADSLVGGAGNDVFVYTSTSNTSTSNTLNLMDTVSGASVDDSFNLSAITGLDDGSATISAYASGDGTADDYILSWTSTIGGVTTTNYVYLQDTGEAVLNANLSSGVLTLSAAPPVELSFTGGTTLNYITAGTPTATDFRDGSSILGLSMGAIDALVGWHKALAFTSQATFADTQVMTTSAVVNGKDVNIVPSAQTSTNLIGYDLSVAAGADTAIADPDNGANGGPYYQWTGTASSGLVVTTNGANTYIWADIHYDRSAEDLSAGGVNPVDDTMYVRPIVNSTDMYLLLTISGLTTPETILSTADFRISGEVITGTSSANNLTGTAGHDGMHGGDGADTLSGGLGDDYLTGDADGISVANADADTFSITSGNDTILDLGYGNKSDIVNVSAGASVSAIAYGSWTATASTTNNGSATVDAQGQALNLAAASGTNGWYLKDTSNLATSFTGSAFADTIEGGGGADTINGGDGADSLTGGTGQDQIVLTDSDNAVDTVVFTSAIAADSDSITGFTSEDQLDGPWTSVQDASSAFDYDSSNDCLYYIGSYDVGVTTASAALAIDAVENFDDWLGAGVVTNMWFAISDAGAENATYVYAFSNVNNDNIIDAAELVLVGTVDSDTTAVNFI